MAGAVPLQIPGGLGGMELAIILLIAVFLFGASKIPKLARATGQATGEFKRGREEIEQELAELEGEATLEDGNEDRASTAGGTTSAETTSGETNAAESGDGDEQGE